MSENTLYISCLSKQEVLARQLSNVSHEEKYEKIIQMGRQLPPSPPGIRVPENLVTGCQSIMYISSCLNGGLMAFDVYSEALISKGLAAVLIQVYTGEPPEALLDCPLVLFEKIDLVSILTPGRSNGLRSLLLRMKQDALKLSLEFSK